MVPKEKAIEILWHQAEMATKDLINKSIDSAHFKTWYHDTITAIEEIFGRDSSYFRVFQEIKFAIQVTEGTPLEIRELLTRHMFLQGIIDSGVILVSMIQQLEDYEAEKFGVSGTNVEPAKNETHLIDQLQPYRPSLYYETRLHDQLLATFDLSELKTLCFSLSIDYEILSGNNKSDKARELILYCRRHNRTAELLERCRALRPALLW